MNNKIQSKEELIKELHRLQNENNILKHKKGNLHDVRLSTEFPEKKGIDLKFKNLVNNMQVGVMLQNVHSEILLCNPKALELLGISEDQLLGKTSFDPDWNVIHEDGSPFPGNTHPVPQAIATRQSVHNVIMGVFRPVNNDRVWLRVDAELQLFSSGTVQQVVCSFVDITKRKHADDQLIIANNEIIRREIEIQKNYAILNSIFESSQNVIIFSLDTNYCYMAFTN
ncbi:MAG: PAS domain-containing protein, partial [Paludibacter sp.]